MVGDRDVKGAVAREIPAGAADAFGFEGETRAISIVLRPANLVFRAFDDFVLAFGQVTRVQLVQFAPTCYHRERIAPDCATIRLIQPPPAPMHGRRIGRVEPLLEFRVIGRIPGSEEQFASGPGQLVIVPELVSVVRELLIGAVLAISGDCIGQKGPA